MKTCQKCNKAQSLANFDFDQKTQQYFPRCRACAALYGRPRDRQNDASAGDTKSANRIREVKQRLPHGRG